MIYLRYFANKYYFFNRIAFIRCDKKRMITLINRYSSQCKDESKLIEWIVDKIMTEVVKDKYDRTKSFLFKLKVVVVKENEFVNQISGKQSPLVVISVTCALKHPVRWSRSGGNTEIGFSNT